MWGWGSGCGGTGSQGNTQGRAALELLNLPSLPHTILLLAQAQFTAMRLESNACIPSRRLHQGRAMVPAGASAQARQSQESGFQAGP